jgi:hypothetical protein
VFVDLGVSEADENIIQGRKGKGAHDATVKNNRTENRGRKVGFKRR